MSKEATVERRHRELAATCLYPLIHHNSRLWRWVQSGEGYCGSGFYPRVKTVAQALANTEQEAEARGLANRDERCLQSDMQRIRERLAAEKAWDEGYDEALMRPRGAVNPYRPEPAKGDGNGE